VNQHPSGTELQELVFGGLSAERVRVIAHLLRGCGTCSARLAPHLHGLFGLGKRSAAPLPSPAASYDEALDRAFAAVRHLGADLPPVRTPEQKKREALALLVSGGLEALHAATPELEVHSIFEALLERSWALRYDDPAQMVQLARAATILADGMSEAGRNAQELADLRCRAWTELANAYRVADDLDQADKAVDHAITQLVLGSRDNHIGARFFAVQAAHLAAQRSFSMACTTLDLVIDIHQRHGDEHLAGQSFVMKGIYTGYDGDAKGAIHLIRRGLASVDQRRDPGLMFSATQAMARFLVDCGQFREAQRAIFELRLRRLGIGGRINELKVRWLEGQIYVGLELLDRAEMVLRQVKEGFEEANLPYKAALAGLELGAVLLRRNHLDQALAVVLECTGVFISIRVAREAMASVLLLQKSAEMRNLPARLLDQVIETLRRTEREPGTRFHPAAEP
jgi:tetratricopeptide (TPR) repeat protein